MNERCDRCKQRVTTGVVTHLFCQREADQESAMLRAEVARMRDYIVQLEAIAANLPRIATLRDMDTFE